MGLRCSLLGHDYGEAFVERDREERGDEVVVTERELKECARCGSEKVTTENTEVRSLQPERREDEHEPPEPEPAGEPASDSAVGDAGSAGGAFTSASDAIEQAEAGMESGDALAGEPDEDDAVILDDDADDEPGSDQWDEPAEPEADPDPEPVEDDAEVVDAGPSGDAEPAAGSEFAEQSEPEPAASAADPDRERGEWPDADGDDEGFDATETVDADAELTAADADESTFEFGDDGAVAADTGFTSAGPVETDESADELDFTLYCPECGFERSAAGSSLRAGDICPECQRGYLAEDR